MYSQILRKLLAILTVELGPIVRYEDTGDSKSVYYVALNEVDHLLSGDVLDRLSLRPF